MEIVPVMPVVDFGRDPVEDLYERLSLLRSQGSRVVPVRYHGGIAWLILGYDLVARTFADEQRLPCAPYAERISMPTMAGCWWR